MGTNDKEIRAVVAEIEAQGWVEATGKKYRKFRCGCGAHLKTIHHSPSDPNYVKNLRAWFRRQECWNEGDA